LLISPFGPGYLPGAGGIVIVAHTCRR